MGAVQTQEQPGQGEYADGHHESARGASCVPTCGALCVKQKGSSLLRAARTRVFGPMIFKCCVFTTRLSAASGSYVRETGELPLPGRSRAALHDRPTVETSRQGGSAEGRRKSTWPPHLSPTPSASRPAGLTNFPPPKFSLRQSSRWLRIQMLSVSSEVDRAPTKK